ncbi:glycosyltransferase family 2 protein [Phnomibacter ginsenosidimutans]|nr:glycosyltransferase [Phnomibacter ginsenosidimutans]
MNELVTIVIPCYMQAQYLQEAIDSVRAQTYPHWECIVVNDASPDHTAAVADAAATTDSRIRVIHKPHNEGLAAARNTGISHANGMFILPLDADDLIHPEYLQKSLAVFYNNSAVKVVYTDVWTFGDQSREVCRPEINMNELCHHNLFQPTALFKKSDFQKTDGYRKNVYGYEDWDMWLQLIEKPAHAHRIKEHLFGVRVKQQSMIIELVSDAEKERTVRRNVMHNNLARVRQWAPELLSQQHSSFFFKILKRIKSVIR